DAPVGPEPRAARGQVFTRERAREEHVAEAYASRRREEREEEGDQVGALAALLVEAGREGDVARSVLLDGRLALLRAVLLGFALSVEDRHPHVGVGRGDDPGRGLVRDAAVEPLARVEDA